MTYYKLFTISFFFLSVLFTTAKGQEQDPHISIGMSIFVDSVWSAHPVDFDILTTPENQYVVYYDHKRQMSIAKRSLGSYQWSYYRFDNYTGWDSHNYITIAVDSEGYLHVSGNMHGDNLIYYRSVKPKDISAFKKFSMTGELETEVTYPVFFKNTAGTLYFQYRDGKSGNGVTLWNKYEVTTKKWIRVFEGGLFDGENEANAYPYGPVIGPDGYFHIIWIWRLTPNANTNHNLSYMKSKDLIHWYNASNKPVEIPAKWSNSNLFVDRIGPWNGLINMDFYIWFNNQQQPVITYHRYNHSGISQIYASRLVNQNWKTYQLSQWDSYTWDLNKFGSIEPEVRLTKLLFKKDIVQAQYYHKSFGKGVLELRNEDFGFIYDLKGKDIIIPGYISEISLVSDKYQKNYITDNTGEYMLVWQTLGRNQDRPRKKPYPECTELNVYRVKVDK